MAEQDEKFDEKQQEKDEKPRAWGGEEKWQRDALSTVIWAGVLILAGFLLMVSNLGIIPALEEKGWSLAFLGAGLLFLLEAAVRYVVPEFRRPVLGTVIFAGILLSIGLGGFGLGGVAWALILIVIGAGMLLGALQRQA